MSAVEVLEAVRARVAAGWTQGAFARDAEGWPTHSMDPSACSWCLNGAFLVGSEESEERLAVRGSEAAWDLMEREAREAGYERLAAWNDAPGRTQAEVLEFLDRAIARAPALVLERAIARAWAEEAP